VRWRFTGFGLSAVALAASIDASAQEQNASAADIALARSLGAEGVQLAEDGNCAAAINRLQRAEALYHAPTIMEPLGECQVALGKVVAGTENLQRVAREPLPARPPRAFVEAQARARKALEWALPKIARLKIHLDMPAGVRPTVKVDGELIPLAALDADRPVDPGVHKVEASAAGYRTASRDITLGESASATASLKLDTDPHAPPPAVENSGASPAAGSGMMLGTNTGSSHVGAEPSGSSKTLAYAALSLGGAGLLVGSVAGVVAISKKSALDDQCMQPRACPPGAQGDIDTMKLAATVSTVGFAVGALGAGGGLVLLLTAKRDPTAGGAAPPHGSIRPFASLAAAGFEGSF